MFEELKLPTEDGVSWCVASVGTEWLTIKSELREIKPTSVISEFYFNNELHAYECSAAYYENNKVIYPFFSEWLQATIRESGVNIPPATVPTTIEQQRMRFE